MVCSQFLYRRGNKQRENTITIKGLAVEPLSVPCGRRERMMMNERENEEEVINERENVEEINKRENEEEVMIERENVEVINAEKIQ